MVLGLGALLVGCNDDSGAAARLVDAATDSSTDDGDGGETTSGSDEAESDDSSPIDDRPDDDRPDDDRPDDDGSEQDDSASTSDGSPADEASTADDDDTPGMDDAGVGGDGANHMDASTTDEGAGGDAAPSSDDTTMPAPVDPISLSTFCDELRSGWLEVCEAEGRDDCDLVDAHIGALACAEAPSSIEQDKIVFDGSAAAACLAEGEVDVIRAWEQAYLVGSGACFEVFLPNARLGDACTIDYGFSSACVEGYCPYSGAFEGLCIDYAGEGESCEDVFCGSGDLFCNDEQMCSPVLEDGEPCDDRAQCASGTCYDGTCRQPATLDEDCSNTECLYPYVCKANICVEKVDEGDFCTDAIQCPDGIGCIYATPGADERACAQLPVDGDPCDFRSGCSGEDVYCEETEEPGIGICDSYYVEEGEPCGNDVGNCRPEYYCARTEGSTVVGTCVADRGIDESCADLVSQSLGNSPCTEGLHCMQASSDTCLPPGELGEPCFYNSPVTCAHEGTYCSYETRLCEPPVAYGERCNLSFPERSCAEGRCLLVRAADCDDAWLSDCQDSLCLDPFENGAECTNYPQCASGFCDLSLDVPVCADP